MARDVEQKLNQLGLLEIYRHSAEKPLLALDALSKLTMQFANKPDFQQLVRTFVFTLSGQFSVSSAFSVLRKPGSTDQKTIYTATGKLTENLYLQSLILTPDLGRYFVAHNSACAVSELDLPDSCSSHGTILNDSDITLVCPLVHNDNLLGLIGLGETVTKKPFKYEDIDLLGTLVSAITPLVASSYHFCEITGLSAWHLDILNNVKQGVFVFDIENRLRKVNTTGISILERFRPYVPDPILLDGVPIEEVFPQVIFVDWTRRFIKANIENRGEVIENLIAKSDDSEYIYEAYLTGISGDSEFQTDFIVTLNDVTERKLAIRELRESEELFRAVFEQAADSIVLIDTETGALVEFNDKAHNNLGYTREEFQGLKIRDFEAIESDAEVSQHIKSIVTEGAAVFETKHRTKGGEVRDILVKVRPISIRGKNFLISMWDDITDRKQAEDQKRNLQEKLERAERMESLGILAGGVAHDLNNMLGPVVGYSELILLDLPEDSKIRKRVENIGKSAQNAADVIQDLLTLGRRGRYEMIPTNINAVIEEYIESPSFIRKHEDNPNVTVEYKLDRSVSNIAGSAPHLSKVVMNLVVNAFDAMIDGGTTTIETSQVYLKHLFGGYDRIERGYYVVLRVKDTGVGISQDDLSRIFEPYYSKKRMGTTGSGLGLSVVYGIVKDHNGYYDVMSEVGQGTEFVLYLPVTTQATIAATDTHVDIRGKETVLVIDDTKEQREIAAELLTSLGYSVHTAENGRDAVKYLTDHSVDIIILDMIMEKDFDGLDTYREILRLHPKQKAVIASGFSETERVEKARELGAGRFIKKPFSRRIIGRAVREELDKKTPGVSS